MKALGKERNLVFYSEIKAKRLKKIKSKLYHRIKNKVSF
jgi:U3 small nucleolar RNA-associated protein 14